MSRNDSPSLELAILRDASREGGLLWDGKNRGYDGALAFRSKKNDTSVAGVYTIEETHDAVDKLVKEGFIKVEKSGAPLIRSLKDEDQVWNVLYRITDQGRERLRVLESQGEQSGETQGGGPSIRIS